MQSCRAEQSADLIDLIILNLETLAPGGKF